MGCGAAPKPSLTDTQTQVAGEGSGSTSGTQPGAAGAQAASVPMTSEQLNTLLADGRQAVVDGDLTTAEEKFKDVVLQTVDAADANPKIVAEARYNLGVLAEWQGGYAEAKRHYEGALRYQPELGRAVLAIGRIMLRDQDVAGALNYASGRLAGLSKSIPLRNALNRLRITAGKDLNQVEVDSKDILKKEEKNVAAMTNLAVVYHRSGKYELAIAVLDNVKAIDSDNPEVYWRLAKAYRALGTESNIRMARQTLEAAAALPMGASAEVYNDLGLDYQKAGDFPSAEIQFRKALARWPDMAAAHVNLGNALKGLQRYDDALASFEKAGQLKPDLTVVGYNIGILLLDGQFPNRPKLDRLKQSIEYLNTYKGTLTKSSDKTSIDAFIAEATKLVEVEKRREAAMRRRAKSPETDEPNETDESGAEDTSDAPSDTDTSDSTPENDSDGSPDDTVSDSEPSDGGDQ
jgi:tetratricopeptide (TPR) repeat protein